MEFYKLENNKLYISTKLLTCENCGKPMVKWYDKSVHQIGAFHGIGLQSRLEESICEKCFKSGKYPKECCVCSKTKVYPTEFAIELTLYPEYPEEDTAYNLVCKECVQSAPIYVIDEILYSDDAKDIREK